MGNPIKEVSNLVSAIGTSVDKNTESAEEKTISLDGRHVVDMGSDSWLSKNIRPLTLIFLMLCEGAIVVGAMLGKSIDIAITSQIGVLLFGAFSFYFNSKKAERVADKNASANLEMKKMQLKADIKADKKEKRRNK